jgi:hypothetical protein
VAFPRLPPRVIFPGDNFRPPSHPPIRSGSFLQQLPFCVIVRLSSILHHSTTHFGRRRRAGITQLMFTIEKSGRTARWARRISTSHRQVYPQWRRQPSEPHQKEGILAVSGYWRDTDRYPGTIGKGSDTCGNHPRPARKSGKCARKIGASRLIPFDLLPFRGAGDGAVGRQSRSVGRELLNCLYYFSRCCTADSPVASPGF